MRTDLFDFDLPQELIAQTPTDRGVSRLLVVSRANGPLEHRSFRDLLNYLGPGDTLVLNDTRVSARRLKALRPGGHEAEVLLLRPVGERSWEALVKPGKALKPGKSLTILEAGSTEQTVSAVVLETTAAGGRILEFTDRRTRDNLASSGTIPLPPYIDTVLPHEQEERYQTVYGVNGGSAAAPTAGLHFSTEILAAIRELDVALAYVTLHVGIGTFRPVRTEEIEDHEMHAESFTISPETADIINATRGRVIAVGTTSVRVLEAVAAPSSGGRSLVRAHTGNTNLFITPGYKFKVVDGMITNFHLPRSTLLMLVSAMAGQENILRAYKAAVEEQYRFFSFGDAMLIL